MVPKTKNTTDRPHPDAKLTNQNVCVQKNLEIRRNRPLEGKARQRKLKTLVRWSFCNQHPTKQKRNERANYQFLGLIPLLHQFVPRLHAVDTDHLSLFRHSPLSHSTTDDCALPSNPFRFALALNPKGMPHSVLYKIESHKQTNKHKKIKSK